MAVRTFGNVDPRLTQLAQDQLGILSRKYPEVPIHNLNLYEDASLLPVTEGEDFFSGYVAQADIIGPRTAPRRTIDVNVAELSRPARADRGYDIAQTAVQGRMAGPRAYLPHYMAHEFGHHYASQGVLRRIGDSVEDLRDTFHPERAIDRLIQERTGKTLGQISGTKYGMSNRAEGAAETFARHQWRPTRDTEIALEMLASPHISTARAQAIRQAQTPGYIDDPARTNPFLGRRR